jgi:L-ascorbate metabolism protein UlaG (beta-lactamase superfamily)
MYPLSDHFSGKFFFNPWGANNTKTLVDVLKWKLSSKARKWPRAPGYLKVESQLVEIGKAASVHATYIGHATVYLQDSQFSILTDPHFSDRASPFRFLGPKRYVKPAKKIEELPTLDMVLISHNHYDHMDLSSLLALHQRFQPEFVVPLGNAKYLTPLGIRKVIELDWWESYRCVRLVPAQHWSARGFADRNQALWGAFVVNLSGKKIFFAGDTGYGPHFKMIQEKCGAMDLSLLPIGAYEARYFMKDQHINPEEALRAHWDLQSQQSFAIHFETFCLTDEGFEEPRLEMRRQLEKNQLSEKCFLIPHSGETLILK